MEHKLCKAAFGIAAATVCVLAVLLFALMGYLGYNAEAIEFATKHSMFFTFTPVGVFIAAVIHGVKGFLAGYIFAWVYNHCPIHSK